jgi:hypothetical protein
VRTGPYTAARWVELLTDGQTEETDPIEESIGECNTHTGTVAEPPRTMRITSGFSRQDRIDTALSQLLIARPATFPLFPHNTPQPPAYPAVKVWKHRGRLAEPKISVPTPKIVVQIPNHYLQAHTPRASRNLPDPRLETNHRFRRYAPPMWSLPGKAESQEFTLPWPCYRTFLTVVMGDNYTSLEV